MTFIWLLAVIAFHAIAAQQRADPGVSCELAAYDLKSSLLLWRRRLDTKGLLNIGGWPPLLCTSAARHGHGPLRNRGRSGTPSS